MIQKLTLLKQKPLGLINALKQNGKQPQTFLDLWGSIIKAFTIFIFFAIFLSFAGLFRLTFLVPGLLLIVYFTKAHISFIELANYFIKKRFSFVKLILILGFVVWLALLLIYSPFPAFSGRDEGSYSNAAIYLANSGSIYSKPTLLKYLTAEGEAHKSLSYPGFVIKNGSLLSQFSPAYFVWLGFFYAFTKSAASFIIANLLLIFGGIAAVYLLTRSFLPRWAAIMGCLIILYNFLFLWFPRFTLSENLAFFLYANFILFSVEALTIKNKAFLGYLFWISLLFPLVRPEGYWLMLVGFLLIFIYYRKKIKSLKKPEFIYNLVPAILSISVLIYTIIIEMPVYLKLAKDFLKWQDTKSYWEKIGSDGGDMFSFGALLQELLPSSEKLKYFLKVEWNYGILIFGILLILAFLFAVVKWKTLEVRQKHLFKILFLAVLPFMGTFYAPQISSDHPWMLRRFMYTILPTAVIAGEVFIYSFINKAFPKYSFVPTLVTIALLFLPSLPASAYFALIKTDEGRSQALEELGSYFKKDDFIFLSRDASSDGWKMWAEPLSSIYGLNAVYVYHPSNIQNMKNVLYERFLQGKKNYILLASNSYNFEHNLKKDFTLILDKELEFYNSELKIDTTKQVTSFPVPEKNKLNVKIYLINPK